MDLDDLACLASESAAPAASTTPLPLCDVLPAPASERSSHMWISIDDPGVLEKYDHNRTKPHHECNIQSLQSKYKLICEADAIFQKHMDDVREQQKRWRSALDTFMVEAEGKCKALVPTTAKGMNTKATSQGGDNSLAHVSEESVDWAGSGDSSANSAKQCKDALQKYQEPVDCFGSENSTIEVFQPKRDSSVKIVSSMSSCQSRSSNRASVLSKASTHHLQRKKSCEDFSKLKKKLGKDFASDNQKTCRKTLQQVVSSTPFDGCVFSVIFANVLFVGIEVDYIASHPGIPVPDVFTVSNYCFAAIFASELIVRLMAVGISFLQITDNKDWAWNWFDVIVVASSLVEIAADVVKTSSSNMDMVHLRVIRIIRVTRLLRTLRMVRMVRFIRALRTLLYSILATLRAAIWSLLLLLIIFYGFGVGLTQAVMDYCDTLPFYEDNPNAFIGIESRAANCQDEALLVYWGTLPRSMFTLFKSVAGGISWHTVVQPLAEAGTLWVLFYILFITFTLFAVLNVVTGLFCQSAIESAKQDKDIATMQNLASKAYHHKALEALWLEMDVENSGNLTIHEFQQALENARILAFFESLDICCNDAWALFHLLDSDNEGKVDKDEFVEGCMQLRGNANAVSVAKMAYDNKIVHEMLEDFMEFMEESIASICHGTPTRPPDAQGTAPWETHSASSESTSCIRNPTNGFHRDVSGNSGFGGKDSLKSGFERQVSTKSYLDRKDSASSGLFRQVSARRAPLSFNRQVSRNGSKEREKRIMEESAMGA